MFDESKETCNQDTKVLKDFLENTTVKFLYKLPYFDSFEFD